MHFSSTYIILAIYNWQMIRFKLNYYYLGVHVSKDLCSIWYTYLVLELALAYNKLSYSFLLTSASRSILAKHVVYNDLDMVNIVNKNNIISYFSMLLFYWFANLLLSPSCIGFHLSLCFGDFFLNLKFFFA